MKIRLLFIILLSSLCGFNLHAQVDIKIDPMNLTPPRENGIWLQPAQNTKAQPVWGFKNGVRIGISPLDGPRGLIRIYTPYLDHDNFVVTNFIALEPISKSKNIRNLSELEWSKADNEKGKRFWSGNSSESPSFPDKYYPAQGVVSTESGIEILTVYIFCETFENGADVFVRVRFASNKPYEFEITSYATEESAELSSLILTATMGNKARLRQLYLADGKIKNSLMLWPDYTDSKFTDHNFTPLSEMITDKEHGVWFVASPNEESPETAVYADDTHSHWKYGGKKATQYWYCPSPMSDMQGVVNGRYTYWASKSPIPGGVSFENFELNESFQQGQRYVFGITPLSAEDFIGKIGAEEIVAK